MSKFCMYCGKELSDNEVCNCREKAVARASYNQSSSSPSSSEGQKTNTSESASQSASYTRPQSGPTFYTAPPAPPKENAFIKLLKRIWNYIKHFFAAPADTISKAANQSDYGTGIFFIVASAFVCSALFIAVLNRSVSLVNSVTGSILGAKYFTLKSFLNSFGLTVSGTFFSFSIFIIIVNALFCVLALAAARIAKSKATFASIIAAIGVSYIGTTCAAVIAVILSLLIPVLSLPLAAGVIILDFSLTYIAVIKSFKLSANKMAYMFAAIVFVMIAVIVIVYKLTPNTIDLASVLPSSNTMTPSSGNGLDSIFGNGF